MKIAFYGNNLNFGYLFVRALRARGVDATLFQPVYREAQEQHEWWTAEKAIPGVVRTVRIDGAFMGNRRRLVEEDGVAALYEEIRSYDLLVMMEHGPELFSELEGVRKVFLSQGSDLQIVPFLLRVNHPPAAVVADAARGLVALVRGDFETRRKSWYRLNNRLRSDWKVQQRQRRGLRQCRWLICAPYQERLLRVLGLDAEKAVYLSWPMETDWLTEQDAAEIERLRLRYAQYDVVFFHPTRQFYLRMNGDYFLKDNDKLVRGYARFRASSACASRLLLVRKGRTEDVAATEELIRREGLEDAVDWFPETENRRLRAYLALPNVVVCDDYSPSAATLGNIGREAVYFGLPLVSAFRPWNRKLWGNEFPPNVFPAETEQEVADAMRRVAVLTAGQREEMRTRSRSWYEEHLSTDALMPRYIQLFERTVREGSAG